MNIQAKLAVSTALIAAFLSFSVPSSYALQTAKVCEEQWKSNKKSIQAAGKKKKDFIVECRGAGPTATAPAAPVTPSPKRSGSTTSAKACEEQWKSNKPAIQASGKTKKVFIGECRTGSTTVAAPAKPADPPKPATTTAAPSHEPKPSAKTTSAPTTAGTPAAANQYASEGSAKLRCPLDTVVWVNLNSGIYHFNGKKDFGTTKRGAYMCEKDTSAGGFRAAKNEKHPQ